ncbi:MAG: SDR family NAD(P)-dependent oxidoreductase [Methanomassiliicoccales archaeon]
MKITGNTILITGGATGIGLALTEAFISAGNEVIICSRNEANLKKAAERFPGLHTKRCDLSRPEECATLHDWVVSSFPDVNILVNNAGIQRMIDFRKGPEDLLRHRADDRSDEIDVNLKAYVYLTAYFVPDLMKKKEGAVVNVSSGLGFIPMAIMPVYSATKAAVHSFSVSLRHQLRNTSVKVFEIIPPTVDTDLDRGERRARGQANRGIPPSEVAKASMPAFEADVYEIAIGMAQGLKSGSRSNFEEIFTNMNRSF